MSGGVCFVAEGSAINSGDFDGQKTNAVKAAVIALLSEGRASQRKRSITSCGIGCSLATTVLGRTVSDLCMKWMLMAR